MKNILFFCLLLIVLGCESPSSSDGGSNAESSTVLTLTNIPRDLQPGDSWILTGAVTSPKLIEPETTDFSFRYKGGGSPNEDRVTWEMRFASDYQPGKSITIGSLDTGADLEIIVNFSESALKREYEIQLVLFGEGSVDNSFAYVELINDAVTPKLIFNIEPLPEVIRKDSTYYIKGTIRSNPAILANSFVGYFQTKDGGYIDHRTTITGAFGAKSFLDDPLEHIIVDNKNPDSHLFGYFKVLPSCPPGNYRLLIEVSDRGNENGYESILYEIPINVL